MKASGNGNPHTCVSNLLQCYQMEVPYERLKGLDASLIDAPSTAIGTEVDQNAEWLVNTYEPRANYNGATVHYSNGINGGIKVTADITEKEG